MADVVTFDPDNLRIVEITTGGDNTLDAQEIYSEWKAWVLAVPSRLGYPPAFRYVGADPISDTQSLGSTYFLTGNWRIRPAEHSHKLTIVGNVFTDPAGFSIFAPTLGTYNVHTETQVSNLIDSLSVNLDDVLESGLTVKEAIRIMLSVLAGKSSGGGTTTIHFRDMADGKDRITATVNSAGDRTAVTRDGT